MSGGILLDTHVVLWMAFDSSRLKDTTRRRLEAEWRGGGSLLVSAVTAWEIAMLADSGRATLDCSPAAWVERFAARPGVEIIPLGWRAAARAYAWPHLEHRDPADRLLMATALENDYELATYDARILAFARGPGRPYGLRVID